MSYPTVSVMFMSYNHAPYLERALDSVLNQTYQDYEIIFSDDCSQDNTKEIIERYSDSRLKPHFYTENQGATINHRYLWKHSNGKYLALINSDDVWLPTHLEKSVAYLEANEQCGAVFSLAALTDEDDRILDPCCEVFNQPNRTQAEWVNHLFTKGNCLCHPSVVLRREVYDEIGFYKLGFRQLPDYNLWTRMVNQYSIHVLQEVLVQHRRCNKTNGNTSAPIVNNSVRDINESLYTLLHYFDQMSDELFVEAFHMEFRNKDAITQEELLCEKFFLMYDRKYYMAPVSRYAAFFFLHDWYDILSETLQEEYGFTLNDFHALGQEFDLLNLRNTYSNIGNAIVSEKSILKRIIKKVRGKKNE